MFKEKFKYYKRKLPKPDLSRVIDVQASDPEIVTPFQIKGKNILDVDEAAIFGLKNVKDWQIYELNKYPGLIFVMDPFTSLGQRYWIARTVADYSRKPSKTNLDSHNVLSNILESRSWWDVVKSNNISEKKISQKLRWATFGYHHNWDTKVYSEESRSPFPSDLSQIAKFMSKLILGIDLNPEASIVNYYLMDSFLSGHTDHSEPNMSAPLLSFSFGQTAIFLIGGHTAEEIPEAIFLRSGDLIIMMESSRCRYHGVPRIIKTTEHPWNNLQSLNNNMMPNLIKNNLDLDTVQDVTMESIQNEEFWKPFDEYICQARINLNVRQVH